MTKEQDLISRWQSEKEAYLAWGQMISETVPSHLAPLIAPVNPGYFIRTLVSPRLKDDQKLVEKAFFRNKAYNDPYKDITDKVGTRFVVLLGRDVRLVEDALIGIAGWTFSKDRDYEEEQRRNPIIFDYAAVHYVVRPIHAVEYAGVKIPADTPCEVQIKTLLQHAYSELTHDTIYKPQIEATSLMRRNAAKAMALLEATNDYFEKVHDDVNKALSAVRIMTTDLTAIYRDIIGVDPKPTALEGLLIGAYEKYATDGYADRIREFFAARPFLTERIKERLGERNPIFTQPSVLLAYLAAGASFGKAASNWPLTPSELEPLANDLGESMN